jgi:alpha-mannosidase
MAPGCNKLVRRVRIYSGSDRIDLINEVDKNPELTPESVYFAFPFNVPGGQTRINVPLAVTRPEKDQLPGANRNYYCVQRWVDVSNADYGVTWVTRDAPMLKFHPFKIIGRGRGCLPVATMMYDKTPEGVPNFWDRHIDPRPFFYSWVMTNHWETNYKAFQEGPHRFEYTLLPHAEYDQAIAQRVAKEVTQPLLAIPADSAKPVIQPPLRIDSDGVVVTSLKPARDGKATMIRLFAASGRSEKFSLNSSEPRQIYRSDPQESRDTQVRGPIDLPAYGVITLRVESQ